MRAVRFDGRDVFLDRGYTPREPEAGEAVVRPTLVAIDGADVQTVRGSTGFKGVIGHRFVGVVEAVGPGADGALVGARVVADPAIPDPASETTKLGLGEHDPTRRVLGIRGIDGCLAERFAVPAAALCRVPDSVPDNHAVFAVPVARVLHASHLVRWDKKTYATVVGEGLCALLMAQVLAPKNAAVRLLSSSAEHLRFAERWGVRHRHIDEAGRRADQDVVVVEGPDAASLNEAMGLIRPRGTVVLLGSDILGGSNEALDDGSWVRRCVEAELTVFGARTGRVAAAVALMEQGGIDLDGLIGTRFAFDDALSAIRSAASEPGRASLVAA